MSTRKCKRCEENFIPSSRHKLCPKCRHIRSKIECPKCGKPMQRTSLHCVICVERPRKPHIVKAGYLMVRIPEHPRASSNNGYVFQHILIMEQKIGRYLLPGENVHHINGVKDDNRPENLELWIRNQPTGQRARDLLVYAREIIALYEPMEEIL